MKLYTEEQVKRAIKLGQEYELSHTTTKIIELFTPIELPSDEEIEKKFEPKSTMYELGFRDGTKWVIDKIKNQQ